MRVALTGRIDVLLRATRSVVIPLDAYSTGLREAMSPTTSVCVEWSDAALVPPATSPQGTAGLPTGSGATLADVLIYSVGKPCSMSDEMRGRLSRPFSSRWPPRPKLLAD